MAEQNRSGNYTQVVYAPTGEKFALMSSATLQKAFVPLPASAQAIYTSSGLTYFRHPDWLGSSRFASTTTPPTTMYSDTAYAPFGEPYAQAGTTDLSFTGQNQDTVAGGLAGPYDFPAREYSPHGRWLSPDPAGLAAVDPAYPQSWNRYAYVLNNPLVFVDAQGLDCQMPDGTIEDGSTILGSWMSACEGAGGQWVGGTLCLDNGGVPSACYSVTSTDTPPGSDSSNPGPPPNIRIVAYYPPLAFSGVSGVSLMSTLKSVYCKAIPSGRVDSVVAAAGTAGGVTGSLDVVTNYNTGQVSGFASGAGFAGTTGGGGSVGVSTGNIYGNLQSDNSNYQGPFNSVSGLVGFYGMSGTASADGSLTIISASASASFFGKWGMSVSKTSSSSPLQIGNFLNGTFSGPEQALNLTFYLLRRPCN